MDERVWNERCKKLEKPLLQIAFDIPNAPLVSKILRQIPTTDKIIVEAGTPLIKKYGLSIIRRIRREVGDTFIIADLKTLDVGRVEAHLAYDESADGAVVSGLAPRQTIEEFLDETKKLHMWGIIDMLAVGDPIRVLKSTGIPPNIVVVHRGIDEERQKPLGLSIIRKIRKIIGKNTLIAIAGGIDPLGAEKTLAAGADIIIVGRYVTASRDPRKAIDQLLFSMGCVS